MNTRTIKAGTTDVSVVIRIVDSTDGTPETGVVFNTAGIDLEYRRELAASVDITEATLAALTTAHADGGFLHIGNGYYRLDLPDAACAAGATGVMVHGTVTGMVVIGCYIELVAYDPYDTVRLGLTALPNAAAGGAAGVPVVGTGTNQFKSDASANVTFANTVIATVTTLTNLPAITANWLTAAGINAGALNGKGDWNIGKTGYALSSAGIQAIWDALTAALTTASSIGKLLVDNINATISSRATPAQVNTEVDAALDTAIPGSPTADSINERLRSLDDTIVIRRATAQAGAASTITLDASASATDELYRDLLVVIVSGIGAGQTRLVLSYVGSTKVATVSPAWTTAPDGTSIFTLIPMSRANAGLWRGEVVPFLVAGRLDASVGAMAANTLNASALAADAVTEIQSGLATAAAVTTIDDFLDTEVAAIKAKTDQLTFTVANQVDGNVQSINDVTITGNGQVGTEFGV